MKEKVDSYPILVFEDSDTLTNGQIDKALEVGFTSYVMKSQISFAKQRVGKALSFKTFHDLFEELAHYTYTSNGLHPIYPSVRAFVDTRFAPEKTQMVIVNSNPTWFMYSLHVAKNTINSINAVNPFLMLDGWNDLDEGSTLLPNIHYGNTYLNQVKIMSDCIADKFTKEACWLYK